MSVRLSNSSMNRYMQCPTSWKLHYIDGLRPTEISSALIFGSAIGKTFEFVLNLYKDNIPLTCSSTAILPLEVEEKWKYEWNNQIVNDQPVIIPDYPSIAYSKYDTDLDLLDKETIAHCGNNPQQLAWYSLYNKGLFILNTFIKEFLPLVEHVYSVEESIELTNNEGDSSIGFSDTVVKLKNYNSPIVLDFKTASRPYELDSVIKSVQLSQYLHVLGDKYDTRLAGYCVFLKSINKNKTKICTKCGHSGTGGTHRTCNKEIAADFGSKELSRCNGAWEIKLNASCDMQLIVDEIPQATEDFIVGNIENIANSIKSGIFTKNVNSCFDNGWGRPCEFQRKCWENKNVGLIQVEKKNDKL